MNSRAVYASQMALAPLGLHLCPNGLPDTDAAGPHV
jgi:hypothetical protein